MFAKLKHWLRNAARRSFATVAAAIGQTLDPITATECRHYFRNVGYDPS